MDPEHGQAAEVGLLSTAFDFCLSGWFSEEMSFARPAAVSVFACESLYSRGDPHGQHAGQCKDALRPQIASWEAGRPIVEERKGFDLFLIWLPQSDSIERGLPVAHRITDHRTVTARTVFITERVFAIYFWDF
jgi:hypothetical protein